MLLSTLLNDPIQALLMIPCVLMALTFHEWAHGYIAYKCGDNTARNMGRLSLNPLRHLDVLGTISLFVAGWGWAKPVPVVTRNFKHPRRDFALVAVAGPLMNLLLAFIGTFFVTLVFYITPTVAGGMSDFLAKFLYYVFDFFYIFSFLNIGLAVFNLIPIPPLDGSRIVSWLLPPKASMYYNRIEEYAGMIMLALVVMSWIPALDTLYSWLFFPISWLRENILSGFMWIWDFLFGLVWKV